ncbi:MAG: hypothetical protein HRU77_09210 [Gammaproteobacteria bacterium]|uniref:DUF5666 domain-containing protein n=1 Tax=candidate division WWE3 bacterium TaxID=2053526 RepID=A0A928TRL6_UNCKA|nr:hypothetical protein [candidate division WWE3 bacterium]QOJ20854.1 MAG: hypothetical protein HRU77_09210 [Gammaproteobacteria bacterium]
MSKQLAHILLMLAILAFSHPVLAGGITPIQEINEAPANFDGREVKLKGIPKNPTRLPLVNLKSYVLEDSSGEITVLTELDLPKMNEEITIRAKVRSLAIVKGEAVGLTVTELERYESIQKL